VGTVAAASAPFVTLAPPSIGDEEIAEVVATLRSGWLTTGPRVREFERRFADYVGAPHAVAVNSCTAALHLSLLASGVGPGAEVVTTPLTFCATVNTIIHAGATPVFVDVDLDTMNIEPAAVAAAVTGRTRAFLPVHFAGRPADVIAMRMLARDQGLYLIEDAAHCVEGAIDGAKIGTVGDFTCFSFYATKNLTTGEGGMVTTASEEWANKIRTAALHGMSRDAWTRYSATGRAHYEVVMPGFKYNMMDVQAAIGLHQLRRVDTMLAHRAAIWAFYDESLASLPIQRPAQIPSGLVHARHLYTILVDEDVCGVSRDELQAALQARGIGTGIHFTALHLHRYYAERFGLERGQFPNAEYISDRTLSLPLSAATSGASAARVVEALHEVLG